MTTSIAQTMQSALDKGGPAIVGDAASQMKLGTMLTPLKRTFTGLTGAATYDLTALDGDGETAGAGNPKRLAALCVNSLRVTAATTATAAGTYAVSDIGGAVVSTATHTAVGVALISDDGKSLTFATADVTAFVIEYIPRAAIDMVATNNALNGAP